MKSKHFKNYLKSTTRWLHETLSTLNCLCFPVVALLLFKKWGMILLTANTFYYNFNIIIYFIFLLFYNKLLLIRSKLLYYVYIMLLQVLVMRSYQVGLLNLIIVNASGILFQDNNCQWFNWIIYWTYNVLHYFMFKRT